jgi:hypothetical protein
MEVLTVSVEFDILPLPFCFSCFLLPPTNV